MPRKIKAMTIRFDPEIYDALRIAAEKERRSVSNMLEVMVLEYAKHLEETGGGVAPVPKSARKKSA